MTTARLLWNGRRFLLRCLLIGLAASIILAFVIPAKYESKTKIMPPDQNSSGAAMLSLLANRTGGGSDLLGNMAGDLLGLKTSSALFMGILASRTVQDELVNRFDLRKVYWVGKYDSARKKLAKNTTVSEERKSGIITVEVTDRNPQRAAAMAQAYVEELNRLLSVLNTSSAHRERVFLENRLVKVREDLSLAANEFSQFASKNTAINVPEQGKAMVEAAATLQGELIAAKAELGSLEQLYAPGNVRVRSLKARIAELERQLDNVGGKNFDASDTTSGIINSMFPSIRKLPQLGVKYADLYRNTKVQEAIFEILTKQYEMAKIQEAKEIPTVKVLDVADIPERRSFPPRLAIIGLGALAFCLAGATWLIFSSYWNSLHSDDSRKLLALEIMDSISDQASRIRPRLKNKSLMTREN
jgi:uncharacterized protein involved in exopolysaccharide biosynthesis